MNKDISIIDEVARNASDRIAESIISLSEFYAGMPGLVTKFNRDTYNSLTPASRVVLENKYGADFVAAWEQKMGLGQKAV